MALFTGIKYKSVNLSRFFTPVLLVLLLNSCRINPPTTGDNINCPPIADSLIYNPVNDLHELFDTVQLSGIFPDSKTFPDCRPLMATDSILGEYRQKRENTDFSLENFISDHFECSSGSNAGAYHSGEVGIKKHLESLWNYLTRPPDSIDPRSSLIPLPYPYVIPGGRFREIYYWDTFFTMEGLAASDRTDLIRDMLNNFTCLIDRYGYIPNGNRTYYLGRSQPPFFAAMVKLYMHEKGDSAGLQYLNALQSEYSFWMNPGNNRVINVQGGQLNRYWDKNDSPRPESYREDVSLAKGLSSGAKKQLYRNIRAACESGWDFSSRWLGDKKTLSTIHTTEILPVDLNCLLYNLENTLAELYQLAGEEVKAEEYLKKASQRKKLILAFFWDKQTGFFYDYDFVHKRLTGVKSLAAAYPLYFKIATPDQADKVAERLENSFLYPGGLVTTLNSTGQQWDAPNGWAPLQWMAVGGLENYGMNKLATTVASRWMTLNKKVFLSTGKMMEKYNVENVNLKAGGGEYPSQDGFGWTNGVYLGFLKKGFSADENLKETSHQLQMVTF